MTYQVIRDGIKAVAILREADSSYIPLDSTNADYIAFTEWNALQEPPLSLEDLVESGGGIIGGAEWEGGYIAPENLTEFKGRLTLESGVAVSTSDQTAKTVLYFTPYLGNMVGLFTGTYWDIIKLTQISIKLTDTQTGVTDKDAPNKRIITGLTDTSQLIVGMLVTGTGVGAAAAIVSIDSATQVTVSVDSTADGTVDITFKIPASKNLDVFAHRVVSGDTIAAKLEFVQWTDNTTRATALYNLGGVYVSNADITRRYLGTIRTTATAGQTEDSVVARYVWNYYNSILRPLILSLSPSHTYNVATIRAWNNGATAYNVELVTGLVRTIQAGLTVMIKVTTDATYGLIGIGLNTTTAVTPQLGQVGTYSAGYLMLSTSGFVNTQAGYNSVNVVEQGNTTSTGLSVTTCYLKASLFC